MIVYDLKCRKDHVFEAWFPDSASFTEQAAGGKVLCPVCGSTKVSKALMAPNVVAKKGRAAAPVEARAEGGAEAPAGGAAPGDMAVTADQDSKKAAQLRRLLRDLRDHVEKNCDYVGGAFAEEARKIHYGETDARNGSRGIYGETSADEAKALEEEGIEVASVPWLPRENS